MKSPDFTQLWGFQKLLPSGIHIIATVCVLHTALFFSFFNRVFSFPLNSGGRTGPNGRDRHSPSLPSRSSYKGRPVCRCHHRDLPGLSVQWSIGQIRCCHDRRDYTEGPGAAGESPPTRRMNHIDLAARGAIVALILDLSALHSFFCFFAALIMQIY